MTQKLVVSVDANESGSELVTIQDVLSHVLELFQLISESDPVNEELIAWRLVSATMNSPFTVTAEAVPRHPNVATGRIAERQLRAFAINSREMREGRIPVAWSGEKPQKTLFRLFSKNKNLISRSIIKPIDGPPLDEVEFTPDFASNVAIQVPVKVIEHPIAKTQMGSIEGTLSLVHHWHNRPAIQIVERKTKQPVWCLIAEELQHQFSESTSVEDIWKEARVLVKGKILYDAEGNVSRVLATGVRRIEPEMVSDDAIVDKEFTGGLSVSEYLEKFRDGNLG